VALWCVLLAAVTYTSTDPDLWGNVRFGLDILRDGNIPHTDAYSFTTDREWVNHEWLAEVLIGNAFRAGGTVGLILLKVAAVGSMLLLLWLTLRREGIYSPSSATRQLPSRSSSHSSKRAMCVRSCFHWLRSPLFSPV
jgi:hypothetical protein